MTSARGDQGEGHPGIRVGLSTLPSEVLLHIISFLHPYGTLSLQLVSRSFRQLCRDGNSWRSRCFEESTFLKTLDRRRAVFRNAYEQIPQSIGPLDGRGGEGEELVPTERSPISEIPDAFSASPASQERDRVRIMANWDPTFPSERISWYDEYIQRHGPIVVNWMQLPRGDKPSCGEFVEARGVALYRPGNPHARGDSDRETLLAVSPLDDGGVCLWDVNGSGVGSKPGAILARSRPGILFIDGPDAAGNKKRSKRVDSGVTECVSVNNALHRAFFAVQSHLIAVDLQTLSVVDCESFPWSITALSAADANVPLTVGTSLGIHLHDHRTRKLFRSDGSDRLDGIDQMGAKAFYERSLRNIFDDEPLPPYAPLSQPGPLSVIHLEPDDIHVAGRFGSILNYDRRKFPSIKGSIHSGATLCSMTSLPYPFSAVSSDLRRMGELSLEQVEASKSANGRTLIAGGAYNTKGSLEIYGLLSGSAGGLQSSSFKNRQTSSWSTLLSVVNHGTRIAFSDGSGYLKWFERDGFTEVRRCKIGHSEKSEGHSLFASMPASDDLARKLLPTRTDNHNAGSGSPTVNDNDLLFWTGEKLGLVRISGKLGFTAEDFEEQRDELLREEERAREGREIAYSKKMRKALESQAEDARFVRNFGMG